MRAPRASRYVIRRAVALVTPWFGAWGLGARLAGLAPGFAALALVLPSAALAGNLPSVIALPDTPFVVPFTSAAAAAIRRATPPAKDCSPFHTPRPSGLIFNEWMRLGGPNGPMGCPTSTLQPHPDGSNAGGFVSFENGVVSISTDKWDKGVWGGYQDGDHFFIDWTTTWFNQDSVNYDKFVIRWDDGQGNSDQFDLLEDMGKLPSNIIATITNRDDTHQRWTGTYKSQFVHMHDGVYTISLEGCDMPSGINPFDHSTCRQGWLHPIRLRYNTTTFPNPGAFATADFTQIKPATTVAEAKASLDDRFAALVLQSACQTLPWNLYRNEENYVQTVMAKLAYAQEFDSDHCPGREAVGPGEFVPPNRQEANESLMRQKPESNTGTTKNDSPPFRQGEYDFALGGLMPIIFKYAPALTRPVHDHVIDVLLDKRGPLDPGDLMVFIVPETENHINLIESSRYLTNDLLFTRTHDPKFDNNANGLASWWLDRLHSFLVTDFLEYNAHPYQRQTMQAMQNLYSYATDVRVKTAAQMVLDYVSVKNAVSSNDARRSVTYRRKAEYLSDNFLEHPDPNMLRLLMLAGNTELSWSKDVGLFDPSGCSDQSGNAVSCFNAPVGQVPDYFIEEMLQAAMSDYRIPDMVLDLIVNRNHRVLYQGFHHYADELYASSPSYLIASGGHYATSAYKVADLAATGSADDIGLAIPTTLIPTGAYLSRESMIRFLGDPDRTKRSNMCVAPDFACGLVPQIPPSYAQSQPDCVIRAGKWSFFNRSGQTCQHLPCDERGAACAGYYVAVYQDADFGVMEAYDTYNRYGGVGFQDFADQVQQKNPGPFSRTDQNRYETVSGHRIDFFIAPDSRVVSVTGAAPFPPQPTTAYGNVMNSDGMSGLLTITNPYGSAKIVMDDRNAMAPRRSESQ